MVLALSIEHVRCLVVLVWMQLINCLSIYLMDVLSPLILNIPNYALIACLLFFIVLKRN